MPNAKRENLANRVAGTARCAVITSRNCGTVGIFEMLSPTTLLAPLNAARTAQRAVPATNLKLHWAGQFRNLDDAQTV